MRLPRLQFTVRRMMLTVAYVGAAIGGPIEIARLRQISYGYWVKSRRIAGRERMARSVAILSHQAWAAQVRDIERAERDTGVWLKIGWPYSPERCGRLIPDFEALRLKYERAARYPWLPLEPDPPGPEKVSASTEGA